MPLEVGFEVSTAPRPSLSLSPAAQDGKLSATAPVSCLLIPALMIMD